MKLVFATNNKHKLEEMRAILGGKVELMSLADIGCEDDIPETAETLEGNALIKARHIYEKLGFKEVSDKTIFDEDDMWGGLTSMRLDLS
jgi:XTP/dITP diphosphohydrolase